MAATQEHRRSADAPKLADGGAFQRVVAALVLLVPVAVVAWAFWPGHMTSDSLLMYAEAKSGAFTDQHSPIANWLWSLGFDHGLGPGVVLTGATIVFVVGAFLVLRPVLAPVPAALATVLVCAFPPIFGFLGYLGRDVWFTAVLLLATGALAHAYATPRRRRAWVVLAVVALWFALALRQNALFGVVPLAVALAWLALGRRVGGRRVLGGLLAVLAGVLVVVAMLGTQRALVAALPVQGTHPQKYSMAYDLAALSRRGDEDLFPRSVLRGGRREIDAFWGEVSGNGYFFGPTAPIPAASLTGKKYDALREAWTDAVLDDPFGWIDWRTDFWLKQIGVTSPPLSPYYSELQSNSFGLVTKHEGAEQAADDYVSAFVKGEPGQGLGEGSVVYRPWIFLLLCVAGAIVLLPRRRPPALRVIGALALGALLYQVGVWGATTSLNFRFELPAVIIGTLLLVVLVTVGVQHLRRDRPAAA